MKRHFGRLLFGVVALAVLYALAVPNSIWDGMVHLTVQVQALDAATQQPIPGATLTLLSERRAEQPELIRPPAPTARTDQKGRATFREMFGAGGSSSGTGVHVGTSTIRCEVPGYLPAEVHLSETGSLRYRRFFIYEQPHSVAVQLSVTRL